MCAALVSTTTTSRVGYYSLRSRCKIGTAVVVTTTETRRPRVELHRDIDVVVAGPAGLFSMQSLAITAVVGDVRAGVELEIVVVADVQFHTDEDPQ